MMAVVAVGILYISFVMASLDRVIDDEKFDRLRKIEIAYVNSDGQNECYKLPESQVLPNSIFYPIKSLRDDLWIYFCRDEISKLRLQLLMRDKKITEVLLLEEKGHAEKAIGQLEKIKQLSDGLISGSNGVDTGRPEFREIKKRIEISNEFYEFISKKLSNNERIERCYE